MESKNKVKILNEVRQSNLGVFIVVVDKDGKSKHYLSGSGCLIGMGLCNAMMQTDGVATIVEAAVKAHGELEDIEYDVII